MAYEVSIAGLAKSYDGKAVLGPVDLDIEAGTITGIIGRSGCGKTTLCVAWGRWNRRPPARLR